MKKKMIILALCAGMLIGATAYAQEIKIEAESQNVIFSDEITMNTKGILFVVKKGEAIDDDSKVYALENADSDAEGKIEFSFVMPETKNEALSDGEYELYIKEAGKPVRKAEFVFIYASLASRNRFFDAVKGISRGETGVNELKTILENADNQIVLKAIGCDTDYYSDTTALNICQSISDFSAVTQEIFKREYNLASVKGEFAGADKNRADELLGVINPVFDGVSYNEIRDEKLTDWLSSYFSGNTFSDAKYELANILYKFNYSVADKIDDLFELYADTMGITTDARYNAYNLHSSKLKVNVYIAELLEANRATSVDSLLETVKNAINSLSIINNGGGGGGGGSSSNRNSSASAIPTATQNIAAGIRTFGDMNKAEWAREAVEGLVRAEIVSGDENGNFRPNDYISREEYVKMLVIAANKFDKNSKCEFKDVLEGAWYYPYVASAKQYGLTNGISETEFGIGRYLTRQDMAVLSLRAKGNVTEVRENITFADDNEIADYAKDAVSKLYMSGAINGIGNNLFNPLGQATRAECAQILFNLFLK